MTEEEAKAKAQSILEQIAIRSALDCPIDDGGLIAAALLEASKVRVRTIELPPFHFDDDVF